MKLKEDILTLIQDLKKKQATSIEGIAARHVLNELEKEIQAMKPEKHEIKLLTGDYVVKTRQFDTEAETKAYSQAVQDCDDCDEYDSMNFHTFVTICSDHTGD